MQTWHVHVIETEVNNNLCKVLWLRNDDHSSQSEIWGAFYIRRE